MLVHLSYIDPGTGSMLLTIIIGLASAAGFALRKLFIKAKFMFTGGAKKADVQDFKIPVVVFSDHKRYWNVFEPICNELEKRGITSEYWTMSEDDPALSREFEHVTCRYIGTGGTAFGKLNALRAHVLVSTTPGLDVFQWKRSKEVGYYAHVFHGVDDGTLYRMFGLDYYDGVWGFSAMMENKMRKIEQMRNLPPKDFKVVGSTYLDAMQARRDALNAGSNDGSSSGGAGDDVSSSSSSAADASNGSKTNKTILVAPSWGPSAILSKYGEDILHALVNTGYHIIVRPHPQSKTAETHMLETLQKKFPEGENFEWNFDNDNFEVLNRTDLMITDFSGIIFDYSFIFDKPMIYAETNFDTAPYDAAWFDEKPWILQTLPELGRKLDPSEFSDIKQIIDEMTQSEDLSERRRKVRDYAWQNRGHAAATVVDEVEVELKKLRSEEAKAEAKAEAEAEVNGDADEHATEKAGAAAFGKLSKLRKEVSR